MVSCRFSLKSTHLPRVFPLIFLMIFPLNLVYSHRPKSGDAGGRGGGSQDSAGPSALAKRPTLAAEPPTFSGDGDQIYPKIDDVCLI